MFEYLNISTDILIGSCLCILKRIFVTAIPCFLVQVQNAADLLIRPLEKFRKEQIGVTKVSLIIS